MSLRDAARALAGHGPGGLTARPLPDIPRVARLEEAIMAKHGLGSPLPDPPDLAETTARIINVLRAGAPLARRDLKMAPLCIWAEGSEIARAPRLLTALLARIEEAGRRHVVRTLVAVYLRLFAPDRPGVGLVAAALRRLLTPAFRGLHDLQRDYAAFDLDAGPRRVAEACFRDDLSPRALLARYGVNGQAAVGGFGSAVWRVGMERFAIQLGATGDIQWVQAALTWTGDPGDIGYQDANRVLAETLLLPFADRGAPETVQRIVLDTLLERIGDPRTRPQNWVRMEQAAAVARRWLMGESLKQFLEIVDDTADQDHWEYRRAFWEAYYNKKWIQEAWVAFGPVGANRAHQAFGRHASFGRLRQDGKQVMSGHAVLLMRIGDYTIADWSHNGRCIIWHSYDPAAPKLYRSTYTSGDLAPGPAPLGGLEQSHHGSHNYGWQHKVAAFIADATGLRLHQEDYRVRRHGV